MFKEPQGLGVLIADTWGASLPLHPWLILWSFLGTCSFHDQVTTLFPTGAFPGVTLPFAEVCDLSHLFHTSLRSFPGCLGKPLADTAFCFFGD